MKPDKDNSSYASSRELLSVPSSRSSLLQGGASFTGGHAVSSFTRHSGHADGMDLGVELSALCDGISHYDSEGIDYENFTHKVQSRASLLQRGRQATHEETQRIITELRLTKPDILRGTPAAVPLAGCGKLLSGTGSDLARGLSVDLHHLSHQVNEKDGIDDFWSHSWHAKSWQKRATLLLHYNGLAGFVCSVVGACMTGALPLHWCIDPDNRKHLQIVHSLRSILSCIAGFVFFCLGLVFWQPGDLVFFDKVCIHQNDQVLKEEGIKSIGGILRASKRLLILSDPTYGQRLWCVFELAAFLFMKTVLNPSKAIKVRPIFHGAVTVVFMAVLMVAFILKDLVRVVDAMALTDYKDSYKYLDVAIIFVMSIPGAHTMRTSARTHCKLADQLNTFSISRAQCFCCSVNHIHPDEPHKKLSCDREQVEAAVKEWFGSTEVFDDFVRREVRLLGKSSHSTSIPYKTGVLGSLPALWRKCGIVTCLLHKSEWACANMYLVESLISWFVLAPFVKECLWRLAYRFREKASNKLLDRCCSVGTAVGAILLPALGYIAMHRATRLFIEWANGRDKCSQKSC
eukprot:TRINITY_DN31409_c0_g1_i1.p1 TRINITY_DN31409_c0_g1~~TRINITY_DN31409_c0_g1_i1.p1  ORF type:complete len:573 (-),score=91.21 TRINITY_DN31409_c0_g1_i1:206-1924(-)